MNQLMSGSSTSQLLLKPVESDIQTHRNKMDATASTEAPPIHMPATVSGDSCRQIRIDTRGLLRRRTARRATTLQGLLTQYVTCLCVVAPVAILLGMPVVIVISYASGVLGTSAWLLLDRLLRRQSG